MRQSQSSRSSHTSHTSHTSYTSVHAWSLSSPSSISPIILTIVIRLQCHHLRRPSAPEVIRDRFVIEMSQFWFVVIVLSLAFSLIVISHLVVYVRSSNTWTAAVWSRALWCSHAVSSSHVGYVACGHASHETRGTLHHGARVGRGGHSLRAFLCGSEAMKQSNQSNQSTQTSEQMSCISCVSGSHALTELHFAEDLIETLFDLSEFSEHLAIVEGDVQEDLVHADGEVLHEGERLFERVIQLHHEHHERCRTIRTSQRCRTI